MSKPISPEDIGKVKQSIFPDEVFQAFNAEIAAQFGDSEAYVLQEHVVDRLMSAGMSRKEIFQNGWLNVEEAYREAGWKVVYYKPSHDETGPASYTFSRKPR